MPDHASTTASTKRASAVDASDLLRNTAILAALWAAYAAVRSITDDTTAAAFANAERLEQIQQSWGVNIEIGLQQVITWPSAFVAANSYYLIHFPVTLAMLGLAFVRDRHHTFTILRNSLVAVTGIALVIHVAIPLAPPRMLPGYIDAGAIFGPDPYSLPGSQGANQFAAMPSMHVAWALLVGWALWSLTERRSLRVAAVAHPLLTTAVVIVTGNHFVADVAIGALLSVAAIALLLWPARRSQQTPTGALTADSADTPNAPMAHSTKRQSNRRCPARAALARSAATRPRSAPSSRPSRSTSTPALIDVRAAARPTQRRVSTNRPIPARSDPSPSVP